MTNKFVWDDEIDVTDEIKVEIDESQSDDVLKKEKPKKRKKIFTIRFFLVITFISLFMVPFFKIKDVKYSGNNFISNEEINEITSLEKGERISVIEYLISKIKVYKNETIDIHQKYAMRSGVLTLKIDEIKPLYQKTNGDFYILEDEKIQQYDKEEFLVPILSEVDEKTEANVATELKSLDYQIIKEISYISVKSESSLATLQMKDGNYVEINISQISSKMPYYLQISEILKSKNAKPGIIHLDIGDYYEPIE